jgi:hypothetical protein
MLRNPFAGNRRNFFLHPGGDGTTQNPWPRPSAPAPRKIAIVDCPSPDLAAYKAMMRRNDTLDQVVVLVDVPKLPSKGEHNGECNRGVCRQPNATWYNSSTKKFYCQSCALTIMSWPENEGLLTNQPNVQDTR